MQADPVELARKFVGPVLIIQGERDVQVSAERDAKVLESTLKSRPADVHQLLLVSGAGHLLRPTRDESDPGMTGTIPPDATQVLRRWLEAHLMND